jgi:hypothetical protein
MKRIHLLWIVFTFCISMQFAQVPSTTCAGAPSLTINGACPNGAPLITMGVTYNNTPTLAATCAGGSVRVGYYKFTTGASAVNITVTATNANKNLAIQIFSGSCAAPVAVACTNAFGAGATTETVSFPATASTTYWIEILNVGSASMDLNSVCVTSSVMGTGAVYIGSNLGDPWGSTSNQTAMNSAFGAGSWTQAFFETANPATLFTVSNCFIFMEGGDFTADEMNTFLTANMTAIQNWVSLGGRLIINAAPNEGGNINYGFGGVTLNYNGGTSLEPNGNASAGQTGHPIFNGPFLPVGTSFTGNYFAHAFITGGGTTALIDDTPGPSLTQKIWGSGRVLFGGMTTSNWHTPVPNSDNLMANIIKYQASCIIPLPVELLSFTGTCSENGTILRWQTASEINNADFIIESSTNGVNYTVEGSIPGAGNSNLVNNYSYSSPLRTYPGNYFRLIQQDYDGAKQIYAPIYVSCHNGNNSNCAVVSTNEGQIELNVYSSNDDLFRCTLHDLQGKIIASIDEHVSKGISTLRFDGIYLSSGVYILIVNGGNSQCSSKFIVH